MKVLKRRPTEVKVVEWLGNNISDVEKMLEGDIFKTKVVAGNGLIVEIPDLGSIEAVASIGMWLVYEGGRVCAKLPKQMSEEFMDFDSN